MVYGRAHRVIVCTSVLVAMVACGSSQAGREAGAGGLGDSSTSGGDAGGSGASGPDAGGSGGAGGQATSGPGGSSGDSSGGSTEGGRVGAGGSAGTPVSAGSDEGGGVSDDDGGSAGDATGGAAPGGQAGDGATPGGSAGEAGSTAVAGSGPTTTDECTMDNPECPQGYECLCQTQNNPSLEAACACHKQCDAASDCSGTDSLCGCGQGYAEGICVSSCFCFCG